MTSITGMVGVNLNDSADQRERFRTPAGLSRTPHSAALVV